MDFLLALEPLNHLLQPIFVLARAVSARVEREVDHQAKIFVGAGLEDVVVGEPHVVVDDTDLPLAAPPLDGAGAGLVPEPDVHLLEQRVAHAQPAALLVVEIAARVEDAANIDGVEDGAHLRVVFALDVDRRGDAGPLAHEGRRERGLLVRDGRLERPAVEVDQAAGREALEHRGVGHEALQEHRLGDAGLLAAIALLAARAAEPRVEFLAQELAPVGAVGLLFAANVRQQIVLVDAPRLLVHTLERRQIAGLAVYDDVEQIPDGHDLAELPVRQVVDQQARQLAQRGALALERGGERDHDLDQGRREGVDTPEVVRFALLAVQLAEVLGKAALPGLEAAIHLGAPLVARPEQPLLDDAWQVLVLERDGVEAVFPERELIAEDLLVAAHHQLAHHLGQIALAGCEGEVRNGGRIVPVLDQGGDLGRLERELLRVLEGREPQHQLVEEEDDALVAE